MAKTTRTEPSYRILTDEEGRLMFDEESRRLFGIPGDEFVRLYDSGYYDDKPDLHEQVIELVLMLPLYRDVPVL
jgi:hypothetical protein